MRNELIARLTKLCEHDREEIRQTLALQKNLKKSEKTIDKTSKR